MIGEAAMKFQVKRALEFACGKKEQTKAKTDPCNTPAGILAKSGHIALFEHIWRHVPCRCLLQNIDVVGFAVR